MSPYGDRWIHTDAHGVPFERPERPAADATSDERAAFVRAVHEYNNRVHDCATEAFNKAFKKAFK